MLGIKELYAELLKFKDEMRLNPPANAVDLKAYEVANGVKLPKELAELLSVFNGGEIFIPGTKLFSLDMRSKTSFSAENQKIRRIFNIPQNYLVFAKLNFGDFICINTEAPFDVIQWDHESNEEFMRWDSLAEWLKDSIDSFSEDRGSIE